MRTWKWIIVSSAFAVIVGCATESGSGAGGGTATAMTAAPAPSTSTVKIEKPGFYTKIKDGRLWVFREGSKELETFLANGDYPLQVVRPGAGPNGMTIKGPDAATIDAYMAAPAR